MLLAPTKKDISYFLGTFSFSVINVKLFKRLKLFKTRFRLFITRARTSSLVAINYNTENSRRFIKAYACKSAYIASCNMICKLFI